MAEMKKVLIALALAVFAPGALSFEMRAREGSSGFAHASEEARYDAESTCELFINTDPVGAEVFIDKKKMGITPLRIAEFPRGTSAFRVEKYRYVPLSSEQVTGAQRRTNVFFTLSPENLRIKLEQGGQEVFINEENAGKTPLSIVNLPPGTYEIEKGPKSITLSNKSQRDLRRSTGIEAAFAAGLAGLSVGGSLYFSGNGQENEARALGVSAVIFGGILGYNLLKLLKIDVGYRKAIKKLAVVEVEPYDRKGPLDYFSEGMERIGREMWQDALESFLYVSNVYPDAQVVPFSVYEAGYCYQKLGDPGKATQYFSKFVNEYPIYELFPYGVYYLLETEMASGAASAALEDYQALRPVRLEDDSGALCKDFYRVLEKLYIETGRSNGVILSDLLVELDAFLVESRDSPAVGEVSLLKGKLLFSYIDRNEGQKMLKDLRQRYRADAYITSEIDRTLNVR